MSRYIYKHVAILGIDGMGNFDTKANTPNLDSLAENGSCNHFALSENPTISAENWAAMLYGTSPRVHAKTNSYIEKFEHTDKNIKSLFSRVRKEFPDAYLASVVNWNPINFGIIEHDINVDFATADTDEMLTPEITARIAKKPTLLFVQFDNVDGAGHRYTYGSKEHIKQIETTDGYIGKIKDAYKQAGIFDETLFIAIADHGGLRNGHGGYSDTEKYVTFTVSGSSVTKGEAGDARTRDVCATALYALGIEIPQYDENGFSSRVPGNIFEGQYGYTRPSVKEYKVENNATPAFDGDHGLKNIFSSRLKLAMFFDNSLKDETGNCAFEMKRTVKYYSDGVMGSRGEFGRTGSALTNGLHVGGKGFSVGAWIKLDGKTLTEDCYVCGNMNFSDDRRNGFAFTVKNYDTEFMFASDGNGFNLITPYPDDFGGGWLNIIHVIDTENRIITVYMNFDYIRSFNFPDSVCGNFDAPDFAVGNDVSDRRNNKIVPNTFNIDDLLIFDGTLSEGDVAKLKEYYNFGK